MKYIDFYNKFKDYPLVELENIKNVYPDFDTRRLYEWQKNGYLNKIINKFYIIKDKKFTDCEVNFIANKLCEPSYLSLEFALNYYSLIPEIVFWRTSITSKKTKKYTVEIGNFLYHSIKEQLFFGYKLVKFNNSAFKIAEPEKALLDFLYLRKDVKNENDLYELRINEYEYKEIIDQEKLKKYLEKFDSKILTKKIKILNKILNIKND